MLRDWKAAAEDKPKKKKARRGLALKLVSLGVEAFKLYNYRNYSTSISSCSACWIFPFCRRVGLEEKGTKGEGRRG